MGNNNFHKRLASYITLFSFLLISCFFFKDFIWEGNSYLHSIAELMSAFLALFVSILALTHFYNRRNNTTLLVGCGFLGASILELYHAFATTPFFICLFPSNPSEIIRVTCIASNLFLGLFLVTSLIAWKRGKKFGNSTRINEKIIFGVAITIITICFLLFALVKFPAEFPHFGFIRIDLGISSVLFLIAIIGYLAKGEWKTGNFDHWLLFSLIINFSAQITYMSSSTQVFDTMFSISHLLKMASYTFMLIGLFISVYSVFKQERFNEERLTTILNSIVDCVLTINIKGIIESCNPAIESTFGYTQNEVIGQNIEKLIPHLQLYNGAGIFVDKNNGISPNIVDGKFELMGMRKDGTIFPIELGISEMILGRRSISTLIIRDITQRKDLENMKDEFVSVVSHELRTPLTSIRGALGLVVNNTVGEVPLQVRNLVDIAYNNSLRLVNLINDILDIEKIAAGKMEFKFEETELDTIIKQCVETNEPYAQQFGIMLEIKELPADIKVYVDKDRLNQVITNLLSNAIKFSFSNGKAEIFASKNDKHVRVSVKNYGTGIPPEFRNKIFGKFEQIDSSNSRRKGGTGLGLSICKAIIEKMGGTINFESEVNASTTFFFDLPLAETVLNKVEENDNSETKKVLICEDDKDVASLLALILQQDDFDTDIAHSAEEAKQKLESNKYDLITLDLILPGQDGISFLNELREDDRYKDIPVIIVSIVAEENKKELTGNAFVIDIINKPIDKNRFVAAVEQAAAKQGQGKTKILHVEDNLDVLEVVSLLLEDIADISGAMTLKEAKKQLHNNQFDLVLLDLNLPDGNGIDLLPLLKRENDKNIPVIIFSAEEVDAESAKKVNAVLSKSATSHENLLNIIKTQTKFLKTRYASKNSEDNGMFSDNYKN